MMNYKAFLTYLAAIFCFAPSFFVFYKTINTYQRIDTLEKKTIWVKEVFYPKKRRKGSIKPIEIHIGSEKEVKAMTIYDKVEKREADIFISREGWLRRSPKIHWKDKVTYYVLNDPYLKYTSLTQMIGTYSMGGTPNIVGVCTTHYTRSSFQLFLDILHHYVNMGYLILVGALFSLVAYIKESIVDLDYYNWAKIIWMFSLSIQILIYFLVG